MRPTWHIVIVFTVAVACFWAVAPLSFAASSFLYAVGTEDEYKIYQFGQRDGLLYPLSPSIINTINEVVCTATTPSGEFLYLENAFYSPMSEFRIGVDGRLHALHPSTNSAPYMDEILISPNGSLLYGVCTQDDSITAFRIDADGQLRRLPFKADTDKFPLNMTFDATGRFAYVICRGTENARDGSRVIDQYRVNANGSLTQLSPWSVAVVGNFGCQIFSSFSKPTIFVPNDKGLTQYSVSPSGQLASPFSTNPLAASEQVFGETDDPLNLVIATGMQDVTGYGFPNELVVTRLNVAGGLGPSSVYGVDRTGRLSHVSPNQNDEGGAAPDASNQNGAAMACIAIDRRKQVLYAIDAANFHIFQFSINADGSLTALSTAPELHARPKDAVGYYYPNDRSSYLLVVAKK